MRSSTSHQLARSESTNLFLSALERSKTKTKPVDDCVTARLSCSPTALIMMDESLVRSRIEGSLTKIHDFAERILERTAIMRGTRKQ
jgi:hypothetical protein